MMLMFTLEIELKTLGSLLTGIDAGDINCNQAGYAMGNSWIAPVESTLSWAPFLYYMVRIPY